MRSIPVTIRASIIPYQAFLKMDVPQPPQISKVCQVLRRETLEVYYGSNVFAVRVQAEAKTGGTYDNILLRWLRVLGPLTWKYLRRVELVLPPSVCEYDRQETIRLLQRMPIPSDLCESLVVQFKAQRSH
ncbi:hypothetical protein LTR09_012853 [Extremus antarcticus]|uniref:Uncharacterized protein n=1 Tax=Extremus antarcticus TaxID=702011 RepID=A0AAJ0D4L0_9PEZI|nr:hypothetical protein LTR09_012853 [Extremus antarcticus]